MWIMLSDAFFSIVKKDCGQDELLVRARRPGDIERVFVGYKATRETKADYLYRARIPVDVVAKAISERIANITYDNFKDSVKPNDLHNAYMHVWTAMAGIQNPRPYSGFEDDYRTDTPGHAFPEDILPGDEYAVKKPAAPSKKARMVKAASQRAKIK